MAVFIETTIENHVAYITLNRPSVLNALNQQMMADIVTALEGFEEDDNVSATIIHGNGRAFAAGADVNELATATPVELEQTNQFAVWDRIMQIKKPVIAAVHGFAFGGGFELALLCDVIFAAEDTTFAFPEIHLGVMPSAGGTQRLTKRMGKAKAIEWLWLGEPMTAKEALQYGVINRIIPGEILLTQAGQFAQTLSKRAPLSLRMIKEAVNKAVDEPLADGLQLERKNFSLLFASEDQTEGMDAFQAKRRPHFKGY